VNQVEQKLAQLKVQPARDSTLHGILGNNYTSFSVFPQSAKQSFLTQTPPSVKESEINSVQGERETYSYTPVQLTQSELMNFTRSDRKART